MTGDRAEGDAPTSPDFDELFAGLLAWPYSLDYERLATMTPRQTFRLYDRLARTAQQMDGEHDGTGPAPTAGPDERAAGIQGVGGLGLDKYECWKPYPGERDDDPFSVPREVVKERTYTMMFELGKRGQLQHEGIQAEPLRRGDLTQLRDTFERIWRANCEKFERMKAEATNGVQAGQAHE